MSDNFDCNKNKSSEIKYNNINEDVHEDLQKIENFNSNIFDDIDGNDDNDICQSNTNKDNEEKIRNNENIDKINVYSKHLISTKPEWKRSKNWEESSPFICNLFFCFYFPFVCRFSPLREENVPEIYKEDKSDSNTERLSKYWNPAFLEYVEKNEKFESEVNNNLEFDFYI